MSAPNPRILPVRERAFRALEKALSFTRDGGWNTTVNTVSRIKDISDIVQRSDNPPVIRIAIGETVSVPYGTEQKLSMTNVSLFHYVRSGTSNPDMEHNFLWADCVKLLTTPGAIWDELGQGRREVVVNNDTRDAIIDRPLYTEGREGDIAGKIDFLLYYIWLLGNPNRWDNDDTEVTEGSSR